MCVWSVVEKRKNKIKITWAQEPVVRFRWYENKERKQKVQGDYRLCVLSPMMKNFYNQPFKCAPPVDKSRQGRILSMSGCASTAHTQHVHTLWSTVTIYLSWYIEIRCWCAASVCSAQEVEYSLPSLPISQQQYSGANGAILPWPSTGDDDGAGQRRKEKDYRLYPTFCSQLFFLFFLLLLFWLGLGWFGWRAFGRLSASWCARPIRNKKKLFWKKKKWNKKKREPPIEWKEGKK